MNFDHLFQTQIDQLKEDGNYRIFAELERQTGKFPRAANHTDGEARDVTVWCSNDYLGMGPCQDSRWNTKLSHRVPRHLCDWQHVEICLFDVQVLQRCDSYHLL